MRIINGLKSAVVAIAFASLAAGSASAVPITGVLSIAGADSFNTTNQTITFGSAFDIAGTADFSGFTTGNPVTMRNAGTPQSYAGQDLTTGSNLVCGAGILGGCIFTTSEGGLTASFNLTSYTVSGGLTISGSGFAYLTGFDPTPGTFTITSQGPNDTTVSFSATAAVPGPIVGAGLPGLVMACGGLLALARRRRQAQI